VKAFKAPSLSRNPKITFIFNRMELMEEAELGMETFRGMNEKYELPMPFYDYSAPYLSLTFSRSIEALKTLAGNEVLGNLNKEELIGFEWVKSKREVSKLEYAAHFGFEEKKAYRHLSKFKSLALVGDNGESPKSNKYTYVYSDKVN
jgi:ATP-dependent DNA helicase RecG